MPTKEADMKFAGPACVLGLAALIGGIVGALVALGVFLAGIMKA